MLEIWTGIDPVLAEARLRGLRRRLAELDQALVDQQALARENPNSFGIALSGESLRSIEAALRLELVDVLRHRQAEKVSIVLDGPSFAQHSAKLADLGVIFTRLQKLFSSVAQAITTGPTTRGPIRADVMAHTAMRLQAIYASSFGMNIAVPSNYNLLGESLPSEALGQLFQLLSAAQSDTHLMRVSGEVGRRSLVHLRQLARHLQDNDAKMNVNWKDFAGTQYHWAVDRISAEKIIFTIDNIKETRSETKRFDGFLVGASLLRSRFEILLDSGGVLEGKFVNGLVGKVQETFGKQVTAIMDETEILDGISGESRTFYTLKGIDLFDVNTI